MSRFASHYVFCSPQQILKGMIVEQNNEKIITDIFSMNNGHVEAANTLFYNGILSSEIISLKQHLNTEELNKIISAYQYVDVLEQQTPIQFSKDKPLLIDFGTNNPEEINRIIEDFVGIIGSTSIYKIIAACTYYPALLVNSATKIQVGHKTNILLWEGLDLVNKLVNKQTRLKILNK